MTAILLVVDDDPDTRDLLSIWAEAEGYGVITAASGDEALALLQSVQADLVLLDAVMPGLDGFETCRRVKARETTAHTPVIFMTGLSQTEHIVEGLAAGGVDYVTKPVNLAELGARIRVHLANARTTQGAFAALETMGGAVIACGEDGQIEWASPDAQCLLDALDAKAQALLRQAAAAHDGADTADVVIPCEGQELTLTNVSGGDRRRRMFRIARLLVGNEIAVLQSAFGLTPREAEVLLWTARGKANKDMSDILNISARTVSKHLEQVFIKVGVENRSSAAAAAMRVLLQ